MLNSFLAAAPIIGDPKDDAYQAAHGTHPATTTSKRSEDVHEEVQEEKHQAEKPFSSAGGCRACCGPGLNNNTVCGYNPMRMLHCMAGGLPLACLTPCRPDAQPGTHGWYKYTVTRGLI